MRNSKQLLKTIFVTTLFVVLFASTAAFAADDAIFETLQQKIYNTLADLREIVYVVSGFGLVMFAVAAIFNKISYKHLGYIMIGLSLLALMFPFLEYFSGTELMKDGDRSLAFKSYLDPHVAMQRVEGSSWKEVAARSYEGAKPGGITADDINKSGNELGNIIGDQSGASGSGNNRNSSSAILDQVNGISGPGAVSNSNGGLAGQQERQNIINAGCDPNTMTGAWNPQTGTRNVCSTKSDGSVQVAQQTCPGVIKDGACRKSTGEIIYEGFETVNASVDAFNRAANAFNYGVNLISDAARGVQTGANILSSDSSFADTMYGLSNVAGSIFGSRGAVNRDLNGIVGNIAGIGADVDGVAGTWSTNYETNPTGSNRVSDAVDDAYDILGAVSGGAAAGGSVVDTAANTAGWVGGVTNAVTGGISAFENGMNRLGRIFGN